MGRRFPAYAWFVLAFNLAVVLWGAYVRATGSGAGCGEHWPLCNGEVLPRAPQLGTIIEFTHRVTSGAAGVLVLALLVLAFRSFPSGHIVRRMAVWSAIFIVSEGLVGAGLVLLGHVAGNTSAWRGLSLAVHLVNTLFLLAFLAMTAWCATVLRDAHAPAAPRPLTWNTILCGIGLLLVGVTGAIAALGDTLFAATSLSAGMQSDFSPSAHLFVRLRIIHPILAAVIGMALLVVALSSVRAAVSTRKRKLSAVLAGLVIAQLCIGVVNLAMLAPIPLQLLHLLTADLVWIAFVLFSAEDRLGASEVTSKNLPIAETIAVPSSLPH